MPKGNMWSTLWKVYDQGADQRIEQGGRLLQIKVQCLMLEDKLDIARIMKAKFSVNLTAPEALGGPLSTQAAKYLSNCIEVIEGCNTDNLPKLAVEATLHRSRIARALGAYGVAKDEDRKTIVGHRQAAKDLLDKAVKLCELPFKGAKDLAEAVEKSLKLLSQEFYTEVTKEEIEAIKKAMVSGRGGIATHSGHWYHCVNGHPVSRFLFRNSQTKLILVVCYRQVRHAYGTRSLPRVW